MLRKILDKIGGTLMFILMFLVLMAIVSFSLVGCGNKEIEEVKKNTPDKLVIETKDKEDGIVKVFSESEGEIFSYKGKMTIEKDPLSTVVTVVVPNDESVLEENK